MTQAKFDSILSKSQSSLSASAFVGQSDNDKNHSLLASQSETVIKSSFFPDLAPYSFQPLPLGTIKPKGWLKDNLDAMATGLPGHMYDFYGYVKSSSWLGGNTEYSGLHEGFPYWFNGIIPLAYALNNSRLKTQIKSAVQYITDNQQKDGWLGPETKESGLRNFWARFPVLLGYIQLLEADEKTFASTVLPSLRKFVGLAHSMLLHDEGAGMVKRPGDTLSDMDHGWGQVRVADFLITLQWMYEHDKQGNQGQILLETMDLLRKYSLDWADWYTEELYPFHDVNTYPKDQIEPYFPFEHGVNVAQGFKSGAVINRFEKNTTLIELSNRAVEWTYKYHGSVSGTILGDERIEGLDPFYGSELCMTVEAMYSLSYLYQTLGDNSFADRAERAAFNALPAAVTGDWWSHQYLTQPNQPFSKDLDGNPFWNVNDKGQTFGLEPNYPCCTVNHLQGYPKFLSQSWVKVGNDGLGHALLSPSSLKIKLDNGADVSIEAETQYPFKDTFIYTVESSAPFNLNIRIPSWSNITKTLINGPSTQMNGVDPDTKSGFVKVPIPQGSSKVSVIFSRSLETVQRNNDAVSILHGPLLYTLDVGYDASHTTPHQDAPNAKEWTILPTKPWNVAIDLKTLKDTTDYAKPILSNPIWAYGSPPNSLEAEGIEIQWKIDRSVPAAVPKEIITKGERLKLRFLPVGSAKIGMTELPILK